MTGQRNRKGYHVTCIRRLFEGRKALSSTPITIVDIIVTNAGQMSVSGVDTASETRDPTLMHKMAMTELGMAATGQPPTGMISRTGVSQTTGGQITQTGAPDVHAHDS